MLQNSTLKANLKNIFWKWVRELFTWTVTSRIVLICGNCYLFIHQVRVLAIATAVLLKWRLLIFLLLPIEKFNDLFATFIQWRYKRTLVRTYEWLQAGRPLSKSQITVFYQLRENQYNESTYDSSLVISCFETFQILRKFMIFLKGLNTELKNIRRLIKNI